MSQDGEPVRNADALSRHRECVVWDLPTRLFHWAAAALVACAYATARLNWMEWHAWAGYALLALLLFRLAWGVLGSETARFSNFVASPGAALRYLAHPFGGPGERQVGHNPAGGWMILVFLALMFGQTLSGLYVDNDISAQGRWTQIVPASIANLIEDAHDRYVWDALLAAVALHLLAILVYAARGQNLVGPMITGHRTLPAGVRPPYLKGSARALLVLVGCALAAAALIGWV
jgi:cytochrome b